MSASIQLPSVGGATWVLGSRAGAAGSPGGSWRVGASDFSARGCL